MSVSQSSPSSRENGPNFRIHACKHQSFEITSFAPSSAFLSPLSKHIIELRLLRSQPLFTSNTGQILSVTLRRVL